MKTENQALGEPSDEHLMNFLAPWVIADDPKDRADFLAALRAALAFQAPDPAPGDGGPAFPLDELNQQTGHVAVQHFGMSLRDYFAAHAPDTAKPLSLDEHCAYRYRYADAMLKARTA